MKYFQIIFTGISAVDAADAAVLLLFCWGLALGIVSYCRTSSRN